MDQESEHDILGIKVGDTLKQADEMAAKAGFTFVEKFQDVRDKEKTHHSYQWGNIYLTLKVDKDENIVRVLLAAD